jgi:ABC-type Fe3+/spermidine/putrescine transport system ATPase subunit
VNETAGPRPGSDPPAVDARGVAIGYGDGLVVEDLDLAVETGEMVVLLGPSGSGKTTILAAIAGFLPIRSGELRLAGRLVAGSGRYEPPERRDVAVVFQGAALWPHLSAVETVAYPIRRRGAAGGRARDEAFAILDQLGIRKLAQRRPAEMSGGEQQRVGLGRALARGAGLHLFDEPTAHLDGPLRQRLLDTIAAARRAAGAAGIYATHDTAEALAIADRLALVRGGRIVQTGSPLEVYERPIDEWAARLTGPASVLEATVVAGGADGVALVEIAGSRRTMHLGRGSSAGPTRLLVRPDWATLGGALGGRVTAVRFAGAHTDVDLATPAGVVTIRRPGPPNVAVGDEPGWDFSRAHLLGPSG